MKFYKGRLKFVIPLSIVVAVSSGFIFGKQIQRSSNSE